MSDVIIFDFEVFKYDTVLGVLIKSENAINVQQIWNLNEIKQFYYNHINDLWVGHNNDCYDNHIMKAILDNRDPYVESTKIINSTVRAKCELDVVSYDLMCTNFYSVKTAELLTGKAIHTTEVSFDIDRKLTQEEIKQTEEYNMYDLQQMYENFLELQDEIVLRMNILKEFNIPKKYLTATEAKLASIVLHSKKIPGIEYQYVKPEIYSTLKIKNQDVLNFYLSEGFRKNEKCSTMICGLEHQLGSGGIHAALKKCHETDIMYLDVSGYYNLVMLNYNLLPRTVPEEGRKLYEYMYHQNLKLKEKEPTKPVRFVYKTILLAVFGCAMNEYTDFYDPQIGSLITITGQLFLVDLLEKLDGKVKLIQSNTDGIMVKVLPSSNEDEVKSVVDEWCKRTGFVVEYKHIDEIYQRDVNCYVAAMGDKIKHCGDVFKSYWTYQYPIARRHFQDKEPTIVGIAAVDYFVKHILPEESVEKYKKDMKMFQYICKKQSFDECIFRTTNLATKEVKDEKVEDINRIFAKKESDEVGMLYKVKKSNGKTITSKIPNIPDNVFLYNDEVLSDEAVKKLQSMIDYQFYIDRIYKRISEFFDYPIIKEIKNG